MLPHNRKTVWMWVVVLLLSMLTGSMVNAFLVSTRRRRTAESWPSVALQARRTSQTRKTITSFDQKNPLMGHELLTKQKEQQIATTLQTARRLADKAQALIQQKLKEQEQSREQEMLSGRDFDSLYAAEEEDDDDGEEYANMSIYNAQLPDDSRYFQEKNDELSSSVLRTIMQDRLLSHEQESALVASGGTRQTTSAQDSPLSVSHLDLLTDEEIVQHLGVDRRGLESILHKGALARDTLIRSNVRLVVSIAKRWAKQAARSSAAPTLSGIYQGGWDRPSLDEAIQEGIFGLARATDKFEPKRGLRFTTYATYWVTNYVRRCFQVASTGCLRLPASFYDIDSKYRRMVRAYHQRGESVPDHQEIANQIGVSLERLELVLQRTRPLYSLDTPLTLVSGDAKVNGNMVFGETLMDDGSNVEDTIELSFLRQCLEDAMATELAPHERDILRLRLGLDDGVTRTANEVAKECGGALTAREVRSAEQRAFRKLRSPQSASAFRLFSYLDFAGVDREEISFR